MSGPARSLGAALLAAALALPPVLAPGAARAQASDPEAESETRLPGASRPGDSPSGLSSGEGTGEGRVQDGDGMENGAGAGFRGVPRGPDGEPLDYSPPAPPQPDLVEAGAAQLRFLDKMTGQVQVIEMRPGETRREDRLEIELVTCRVPADDARRDAFAYLRIRDVREEAPRFTGWMFASSPALSALDHARYDVWVESCSASSGEQPSDSE